MADKTKDIRIKKEKNKIKKILSEVSESKIKLNEKLIENVAFMAVTLEDLQETINREGSVIVAKNGNGFDVTQEHPAQKAYVAMMSKYTPAMNQLMSLLPDSKQDSAQKAGEKLAKLVAGGRSVELR